MTSKSATFPKLQSDFVKYNGSGEDTVFNTVGPSLTRQEFAEECDINTLMSKYDAHVIGGPGNMSAAQPFYADFANIPDTLLGYMEFMDMAETQFMRLPAVVRREFDNNAHQFVEFAANPANLEQMRSWGLAEPAKVDPPAAAPAAPPAPPAAPAASSAPAAGASTHGST